MRTLLLAAIAVLPLALQPAFAGEGQDEPFPYAAPGPLVAQQLAGPGTGSEAEPVFARIAYIEIPNRLQSDAVEPPRLH